MTILPANQVQEGDSLPGLDDGYIVEVENNVEVSNFTGRYNSVLGTYTVITFHDAEGDENYLIVNPETPIEVGYRD